jgi:cysteine synthase A
MGTGLAIVCGIKGYPFVAVMSRGNSPERARMMSALGAEVILVDQSDGAVPGEVSGDDLALVDARAKQISQSRNAFRADQFNRRGNPDAHATTTAPELWADSGESLTAFVDFAGSGGTYAGTIAGLQSLGPVRGYVVEPTGAAVLSGQLVTDPAHPIQGGGYSMPGLVFLHDTPVEGYLRIPGDQARQPTRDLARIEGIFGGFSGGANVAAALDLLRGAERGGTIGVIICDSGLKYLSTDLWP